MPEAAFQQAALPLPCVVRAGRLTRLLPTAFALPDAGAANSQQRVAPRPAHFQPFLAASTRNDKSIAKSRPPRGGPLRLRSTRSYRHARSAVLFEDNVSDATGGARRL